uniref:Venom protein n=1 Tax=Ampulex compressa TaxID=860918 RepID=A0A1W6EWE0_AMPCP|nr:venom protein [Ampulex compressa]
MSRQMSPFRFLTTFYVASSFFYDCEAHLWDSTRERYNTVVADAMIKSLRLEKYGAADQLLWYPYGILRGFVLFLRL